MLKKIKNILLNVFGDGFFGLERDNTTQIDISKDNEKKPVDNIASPYFCDSVCYGTHSPAVGYCALPNYTTGMNNVAIASPYFCDSVCYGTHSPVVGYCALPNYTTGMNNVAIGCTGIGYTGSGLYTHLEEGEFD